MASRRPRSPDVVTARPLSPRLEPVKSTRIYQEIVRQIKALVGDGKLKSGDRLPPERELTERFRVSRTSVREALRAIESTGLIEIRPGEGAFVRHAHRSRDPDPAAPLLPQARV